MTAWAWFVEIVAPILAILLVVVLCWAANERGRVHRLERAVKRPVVQSLDWGMAMAATAWCA